MLDQKHILLTQLRLQDYAGSEIVTFELADYFSRQGARVSIVTTSYGLPIQGEFEKLSNIKVYILDSAEYHELVSESVIDIAWIHHQIIPSELVEKSNTTHFIFHHMSPYSAIEAPIFSRIENALASAILCNSQETLDEFISKELVAKDDARVSVLNNPAPDKFRGVTKKKRKLESLLVVSNHMPDELKGAMTILQERGVSVSVLGAHDEEYRRVTPDDIKRYDAVVSIGKTVQYSILSRRPVYCYDRFGGPGYLERDNFQKCEEFNFSGRGFSQKQPSEIADEIVSKFTDAQKYVASMSDRMLKRYTLEERVADILKNLSNNNRNKAMISKGDIEGYKLALPLLMGSFSGSAHRKEREAKQRSDMLSELEKLRTERQVQQGEINRLNGELLAIMASKSYRAGNIIAKLARLLKDGARGVRSQVFDSVQQKGPIESVLTKYYRQTECQGKQTVAVIVKNSQGPSSSVFIRLISPLIYSEKYIIKLVDGDNFSDIDKDVAACVVQRIALPDMENAKQLVNLLKDRNISLITDTDDAFCDMDASHPEYEEISRRSDALTYLIENADVNMFSTQRLVDIYNKRTGRVDGVLVENTLDKDIWSRWKDADTRTTEGGPLQILYMGTPTHGADFKMVQGALDRIHAENPGSFTLSVMGVSRDLQEKEWIRVMPIEDVVYPGFVRWFSGQGPFDIGISPLVDNEFNRNKSDIKCLDYLAVGVQPVVSDVVAYRNSDLDDLVVRVENTQDAWYDVINRYIRDKQSLRGDRDRVRAGYQYLSTVRSSEVATEKLEDILDSLTKEGR